jgi:hypothetical protein
MTDDKEEPARIVTWEQWPILGVERFRKYPLAPIHTDEDVERLLKHDMGLAKKLVTLQARIKELEEETGALNLTLGVVESGEALRIATARIKELEQVKEVEAIEQELGGGGGDCPDDDVKAEAEPEQKAIHQALIKHECPMCGGTGRL